MPLSELNLLLAASWTLDDLISGFDDLTQPQETVLQYSLSAIDFNTYNQLLAVSYSIPANNSMDFDLWSFDDLLNQPGGFQVQGALCLVVLPVIGQVYLSPSVNFGLQWFFGSPTSPPLTLAEGGGFLLGQNPSGPAYPVSATARNLNLANQNTGGVAATGYLLAVGG